MLKQTKESSLEDLDSMRSDTVKGRKILMISPSFYPAFHYGGPIYSAFYLLRGLVKLGHEVQVLTTNANGKEALDVPVNEPVNLEGMKVYYFRENVRHLFSTSLLLHLRKKIKNADLVIVQSVFSYPTALALLISRMNKNKVILMPRGSLSPWSMTQRAALKRAFLSAFFKPYLKSILFHATSEQEKIELEALMKGSKSFVVPNGINPEDFDTSLPVSRTDYWNKLLGVEIHRETKVISAMGRIHEKKGFDILIKALAELKNHQVILAIAGQDFGQQAKLVFLAEEMGLKDKVHFIGPVAGADKTRFLQESDVFALASHNENFGIVYLEALACATPIVASTNTPWQSVEEEGCGKWVPNTSHDFAMALEEVLDNRASYNEERLKAFVSNYTWEKLAGIFEKQAL